MNWSKTQLAELKYFCTSTRSRVPRHFIAAPFSMQIEIILDIFFHYSVKEFQIDDIKQFFKMLRIPKARSDGLRNPSPRQIAQALDRMKTVRPIEDGRYQIIEANASYYADELKYGYEKGYIQYFMEEHTC